MCYTTVKPLVVGVPLKYGNNTVITPVIFNCVQGNFIFIFHNP